MNDLTLNYRVEGSGPPLLLVHGFGISFNIWRDLLPRLCPHFTLVMVELPGIGASPMIRDDDDYLNASVRAVERLRLALGFDSWDVLGYSTGSRLAEAYVQTYASHVDHAIFLCPLVLDTFKLLTLRFALWMDAFVPAVGNWVLRGWRLRFLILLFGFSLQPDPHLDEWQREINAVPVRVLKETARMALPMGRRNFSTSVPFSLVWGDEDIVPAKPRQRGACDYFVHSNHAAPMLAAEEVAKTILSILKQPS